ncbi:hypothetical protein GGI12_000258 [Dipsacomyces acuminosporus]|nr:hypothetical protein GGI12_000258 [Dipsacomyces acuminosporus]
MRQAHNASTLKQRKDTFLRRGRFRWPYIKYTSYLAQPDTLASAGFSFNPVKDSPDNVQCFYCGFELTGWEPSDDPFSEHFEHQPNCKYAQLHCQTRESRPGGKIEWVGWPLEANQELALEEKQVEARKMADLRANADARKATFETASWPHSGRADWTSVTPENLSLAGFYFTPEWPGDDTATCAFCGYALAEWEPEDDPNTEHARRAPDCLFFKLDEMISRSTDDASPHGNSTSKRASGAVVIADDSDAATDSDSSQISKRQRLSNADAQEAEAEDQGEAEDEDEAEDEAEDGDGDVGPTVNEQNGGDEYEISEAEDNESINKAGSPAKELVEPSGAEIEDGQMAVPMSRQPSNGSDVSMGESVSGAQMPSTRAPESPEMQIYDSAEDDKTQNGSTQHSQGTASGDTQQSTQVDSEAAPSEDPAAAADACSTDNEFDAADTWELTEEEESMPVEAFIRACCSQKVASLEASAAQMITAFMQRAEDTRDRISSVAWR